MLFLTGLDINKTSVCEKPNYKTPNIEENDNVNNNSLSIKRNENFVQNRKKLQESFKALDNFKEKKINLIETFITDIDIEIIENSPDENVIKKVDLPPNDEIYDTDYKSRFKLAQSYFQSLEELSSSSPEKSEINNECELLLRDQPAESPKKQENKKVYKKTKSHSLPSSEFAQIWTQMQEHRSDDGEGKYVKISEKFNVDDLFNDVVGEGRLSRQGSFKGIPHKKAVLEMFKSMENISDKGINSYEIAISQLSEFAKQRDIKNAQTYLTEYPFLPTTDPSKYHSRIDAKASGLISRTELLNSKPRRNSVPDLRMNAKFVVNL